MAGTGIAQRRVLQYIEGRGGRMVFLVKEGLPSSILSPHSWGTVRQALKSLIMQGVLVQEKTHYYSLRQPRA